MDKQELIRWLREKISNSGLSQREWARQHGTTRGYVAGFLSGERTPGPALLKAMNVMLVASYHHPTLGELDLPGVVNLLWSKTSHSKLSIAKWAAIHGTSPPYVHLVLSGHRRPGPTILKILRLKRRDIYLELPQQPRSTRKRAAIQEATTP